VITADGLIVRRDRDPGDVVVPGTSILYLVSLKEVWVSAWVDETMQARSADVPAPKGTSESPA
jgi:multidrug resistance efflux pump